MSKIKDIKDIRCRCGLMVNPSYMGIHEARNTIHKEWELKNDLSKPNGNYKRVLVIQRPNEKAVGFLENEDGWLRGIEVEIIEVKNK